MDADTKRAASLTEYVLASVGNDPAEALTLLTQSIGMLAAISVHPRAVIETARAALDDALAALEQPTASTH